jgi:spore coat protein A, manganese oxidase
MEEKIKERLMLSRRQFLKASMITGAAVGLGGANVLLRPKTAHAAVFAQSPQLTKWIQPIRNLDILKRSVDNPVGIQTIIPNGLLGLPGTGTIDQAFANTTFYQVTAAEFSDQLHPNLGLTKLWGYRDSTKPPANQTHLGGVIITTRGNASRIRFTNTLPSTNIIPVDTSIPGANVAQNRMAVHLHGGLVPWISDGGPFDWWTPGGANYATGLSFLNGPGSLFDNLGTYGMPMANGQADYFYPNDQSTRLVWYHDHAHGITRINAYAGIATGYLILDMSQETKLAGKVPSIFSTIPLVFQDKIFVDPATIGLSDPTWGTVARTDVQSLGSLWYAHVYDPTKWRSLTGTGYIAPPNPSNIPEFFGDTMLCNGLVYPLLTVEPKAYRFLFLNACNARFLNINLLQAAPGGEIATNSTTLVPNLTVNPPGPNIIQLGTEGGYLPQEVVYTNNHFFSPITLTGNLLLGNAERADCIIDFTGIPNGTEFVMYNDAPGPFPVGDPANDYFLGSVNPIQPAAGTGPDTRQILRIKVQGPVNGAEPSPSLPILSAAGVGPDPALLADISQFPNPLPVKSGVTVNVRRDLTLNENFDQFGRLKQMLGTTKPGLVSKGFGLDYLAAPTEVVQAGAVEVWRIFNMTGDTHPIHFHLVNVQVLSRQPFAVVRGKFTPTGVARGPEASELGWKETVKMHPSEVITVIMKFDLPTGLPFVVPTSPRATDTSGFGMGLPAGKKYHEYVWHCHILEHEEHDMMRPLVVFE